MSWFERKLYSLLQAKLVCTSLADNDVLAYDSASTSFINQSAQELGIGAKGTWTPDTYTADAGNWSTVTAAENYYHCVGDFCFIQGLFLGTTSDAGVAALYITGLPVAPADTTNAYRINMTTSIWKNNVSYGGFAILNPSTKVILCRMYDRSALGAAANTGVCLSGFYRIG